MLTEKKLKSPSSAIVNNIPKDSKKWAYALKSLPGGEPVKIVIFPSR